MTIGFFPDDDGSSFTCRRMEAVPSGESDAPLDAAVRLLLLNIDDSFAVGYPPDGTGGFPHFPHSDLFQRQDTILEKNVVYSLFSDSVFLISLDKSKMTPPPPWCPDTVWGVGPTLPGLRRSLAGAQAADLDAQLVARILEYFGQTSGSAGAGLDGFLSPSGCGYHRRVLIGFIGVKVRKLVHGN